jgi:hypothetical protein
MNGHLNNELQECKTGHMKGRGTSGRGRRERRSEEAKGE